MNYAKWRRFLQKGLQCYKILVMVLHVCARDLVHHLLLKLTKYILYYIFWNTQYRFAPYLWTPNIEVFVQYLAKHPVLLCTVTYRTPSIEGFVPYFLKHPLPFQIVLYLRQHPVLKVSYHIFWSTHYCFKSFCTLDNTLYWRFRIIFFEALITVSNSSVP